MGVISDAIDDAFSQKHLCCDFIAVKEIEGLITESKSLCSVGSDLGEFEIVFLLPCGVLTSQIIDLLLVITVSRDCPLIAEIWLTKRTAEVLGSELISGGLVVEAVV